jgi:hypothetical protein
MKHTKGEWTFLKDGCNYRVYRKSKFPSYPNKYIAFIASEALDKKEEVEANAKLIAAAPKLLEALQKSQAWLIKLRDNFPASELTKILSAGIIENEKAIKKATE